MSGPTVSVVIPVLNEEAHLGETLESVLAQSYDGLVEILVVDGGSTDGTRAVARARRTSECWTTQGGSRRRRSTSGWPARTATSSFGSTAIARSPPTTWSAALPASNAGSRGSSEERCVRRGSPTLGVRSPSPCAPVWAPAPRGSMWVGMPVRSRPCIWAAFRASERPRDRRVRRGRGCERGRGVRRPHGAPRRSRVVRAGVSSRVRAACDRSRALVMQFYRYGCSRAATWRKSPPFTVRLRQLGGAGCSSSASWTPATPAVLAAAYLGARRPSRRVVGPEPGTRVRRRGCSVCVHSDASGMGGRLPLRAGSRRTDTEPVDVQARRRRSTRTWDASVITRTLGRGRFTSQALWLLIGERGGSRVGRVVRHRGPLDGAGRVRQLRAPLEPWSDDVGPDRSGVDRFARRHGEPGPCDCSPGHMDGGGQTGPARPGRGMPDGARLRGRRWRGLARRSSPVRRLRAPRRPRTARSRPASGARPCGL